MSALVTRRGARDRRDRVHARDDHPAVLDSLSRVLEHKGINVVAQVRDGEDALSAIEELKPRSRSSTSGCPALGPRRGAADRPRTPP